MSQVGFGAAEDLTHETFFRVLAKGQGEIPEGTAGKAWLIAIARNLCIDHLRRQGRWRRIADRLRATAPVVADVELEAVTRLDLDRVHSALAAMRRRDRELIGLRVAAGLSYREMAELLGSSEQIVKVATYRALSRLRHQLAAGEAAPETNHA